MQIIDFVPIFHTASLDLHIFSFAVSFSSTQFGAFFGIPFSRMLWVIAIWGAYTLIIYRLFCLFLVLKNLTSVAVDINHSYKSICLPKPWIESEFRAGRMGMCGRPILQIMLNWIFYKLRPKSTNKRGCTLAGTALISFSL